MVDTQAGGLYGVVAQPLTQDYLAAQLPIFQPKVPTFSQVKFWCFHTDCERYVYVL